MTKARDISKLLSTANGKIAGENLDVSFENITDTGTEGTRVATGTSAQRDRLCRNRRGCGPTAAGRWRPRSSRQWLGIV